MLEYLLFAVCAIVFLVVTILALMPGSKRQTTVPGPDVIDDLEGHFPDIQASGSLHEFLVDLHERYGDIVSFSYGPQLCVSIASPKLFKEQAKVFDRPGLLFELFEPLITPHSIQFANGGEGRRRHAAYSRSFTHENIHMYMDTFCKLSKEFTAQWEKLPSEEHIALGEYMSAFAAKIILQVAFGQNFEGSKEVLEFYKCYRLVWKEMESRLGGDPADTAREKSFEKSKDKMFAMLLEAYKQAKNNQLPETDHKRFIDEIMDLDLPEETIVADMMTVCIGGFHTTGLLLTWCAYFLASHPDVQEKVYDELQEVLGQETITFKSVGQLTYMRQVLDETLRCSQLATMASRVQNIDTELGGHQIPAGTPVVHALGVILQDEKLWPEPELFDPERFSPEKANDLPSYAFEPFGFAGKRKCLGYRMSYFEATTLLSEVLRKFKIKMVEGQVVQKQYGLVTSPKEEVWVTLEKRS